MYSHCYDSREKDSTSLSHALVYNSLTYKESNHRNFLYLCLWHTTALFFQSGFFQKKNEDDALLFKNLHACGDGYQAPPSDETWCNPYFFTAWDRNRSDTNTFHSFDMWKERISLSFGSITTHQSHSSSDPPAFIAVSSTMNSLISLLCKNLIGLYFCFQCQIDTWLIFINIKKDNALASFLNDNPRKYKYNP